MPSLFSSSSKRSSQGSPSKKSDSGVAAEGSLSDASLSAVVPPPPPPPPAVLGPERSSGTGAEASCGCTTKGVDSVRLSNGEGAFFQLRTGPNYKKNGKKAHSKPHMYEPVSIDFFKRESILSHVSEHLTLPPPPDGAVTNESGVPRRLVINLVVPIEPPPLLRSNTDGACYQIVCVFAAASDVLKAWQDEASPAAKLFARFVQNAPEGLLPETGDLDIKERIKIIPWIENAKEVGLPGWLEGYNGKPALLTKSGSIHRGDDYLEITMNLFRFGFLTRKGMHHLTPTLGIFQLHCALTIEGREDDELDERAILACNVQGVDLVNLAKSGILPDGPPLGSPSSKSTKSTK
mmetsp:Transcript_22228/g.56773  ORF Transcript_22228/g.56773 Transcript_22228/m.56773 type:complete len:349 (+) Transcript_22228:79-1125(+)